MNGKRSDWEQVNELGVGGQSEVFLVRTPERVAERTNCISTLRRLSGQGSDERTSRESLRQHGTTPPGASKRTQI